MNKYPATIVSDIDGCIFKHISDMTQQHLVEPELLPGVIEKFKEWEFQGHKIILITGRKESTRQDTEAQLRKAGLFWDHLIMGLPRGTRIIINDMKPNDENPTAKAVNLIRNQGMKDTKI